MTILSIYIYIIYVWFHFFSKPRIGGKVKFGGVGGLYRGLQPTLLGILPHAGTSTFEKNPRLGSQEKTQVYEAVKRMKKDSKHMGVSKNRGGPPKSSILIEFSIINHPFWVPLFLKTPII